MGRALTKKDVIMLGGSLTRYHTPPMPPQTGKGVAEELIKLAGPFVLDRAGQVLDGVQHGQSVGQSFRNASRGLKRAAATSALNYGKRKLASAALDYGKKKLYKTALGKAKDLFG